MLRHNFHCQRRSIGELPYHRPRLAVFEEKAPEKQIEGREQAPSTKGLFDPAREWNGQVYDFVRSRVKESNPQNGEKWAALLDLSDLLNAIQTGREYEELKDDLSESNPDIRSMEINTEMGILTFLDEDGEAVAKFDVKVAIERAKERVLAHDRDVTSRRAFYMREYRLRRYETGQIPISDYGGRIAGDENDPRFQIRNIGAQSGEGSLDPKEKKKEQQRGEEQISQRMSALLADSKTQRNGILAYAMTVDEEGYSDAVKVRFSNRIKLESKQEFERQWPFLMHSREVDDLLREDPPRQAGYTVNPFKIHRTTREDLRQLLAGLGDNKLHFRDVAEKIYGTKDGWFTSASGAGRGESEKRFTEFKGALKEAGISDPVLALLNEENSFWNKVPILSILERDETIDDLHKTYRRVRKLSEKLATMPADKVPEEYKELFPRREEVARLAQILGDYIVYCNRLVDLVGKLRETIAAADLSNPSLFADNSGVGLALHEIYQTGTHAPSDVTRLDLLFGDTEEAPVSFSDLNGRTMSLQKNWFADYMTTESAYLLAYEAAEKTVVDENGDAKVEMDESQCMAHLNYMLQLGITAYQTAAPKDAPLSQISNELGAAGVEYEPAHRVSFSGNPTVDLQRLYKALMLNSMQDAFGSGASATNDAMKRARSLFIQMGSVVHIKNLELQQQKAARGEENKLQELRGAPTEPLRDPKSSAEYQEALSTQRLAASIEELEKSANAYDEVRAHMDLYPHFAQCMYMIDAVEPALSDESKRQVFAGMFQEIQETMARNAVHPEWEEMKPSLVLAGNYPDSGATVPLPVSGPDSPSAGFPLTPYIGMSFPFGKKTLVYRISSDVRTAEIAADAKAAEALKKNLGEKLGADPGQLVFEEKSLTTSGDLMFDPESGHFVLRQSRGADFDFSNFTNIGAVRNFRRELAIRADIFVDLPEDGKLRLTPAKAHGSIEVYVDPLLADKVAVCGTGGDLFLSVKKGVEISMQRTDITLPFRERGGFENTTIVIGPKGAVESDVVKRTSTWYLQKIPGREWQRLPLNRNGRSPLQDNLKLAPQYNEWIEQNQDLLRADRTNIAEMQQTHNELVEAVSAGSETKTEMADVRPAVKDAIALLKKDKTFVTQFMEKTTEGFEYRRKGIHIRPSPDWRVDFPEVARMLGDRVPLPDGAPLSPIEFQYLSWELTVASFQDIQNKKDVQKEYLKYLDGFHRTLLTSIFSDYFKDPATREADTKKCVDWIIDYLKGIDILKPGEMIDGQAAVLVGMRKITGLRYANVTEDTHKEYGAVGARALDLKAAGPEGMVARFWLDKMSFYKPGVHTGEIPGPEKAAEFEAYQEKIYANLDAPLVRKLLPLASYVLSSEERRAITKIYQRIHETDRVPIGADNKDAVKKLLDIADAVRKAQLAGTQRVSLEQYVKGFAIKINTSSVKIAAFKKCGNPIGIVNEEFEILYKNQPVARIVSAGQAVGVVGASPTYGAVYKGTFGFGVFADIPAVTPGGPSPTGASAGSGGHGSVPGGRPSPQTAIPATGR